MKLENNLLKFVFSLFAGVLAIALLTSLTFIHFSDRHVHEYRRRHMVSMANKIEQKIKQKNNFTFNDHSLLKEFNHEKSSDDQPEIPYPFSFLKKENPAHKKNVITAIPDRHLWLVNENGKILSAAGIKSFGFEWRSIDKPKSRHELISLKSWIRPSYFILKLKTKKDLYLVLEEELLYFDLNYLSLILGHSFLNTSMAMLLALLIVFYYLRKKSRAAAKVMSQLESGNLKARFDIGRFDEFTSLLCDFNRMADKIEQLVVKLRNAESARTQLIQELGHDLKTPLTSMMTNTETLVSYYDDITPDDRNDLMFQLKADILYFKQLIENLTEMASLDEPSYKLRTSKIDLKIFLTDEFKNRQSKSLLSWIMEFQDENSFVLADPHLINRLFRNAFDNSARYAKSAIKVKVLKENHFIKVLILDDGPGLNLSEINLFAKRRERRKRRDTGDEFSLGFGSIIMKSIVELHGGKISISNIMSDNEVIGSCLEFTLPTYESAHKQGEKPNSPALVD